MRFTYSDDSHTYRLDGKPLKSVSTVAKVPDDDYALREWQKRQVAIGLAMSDDLREKVAAHYTDIAKMKVLCEEAMALAGASRAAGRGTAAHRITESLDLGEPVIDTPLSETVRAGWLDGLAAAGLVVLPQYVERFVLYPDDGIAGRFDRVVAEKDDDRHLYILDLKTGDTALRYPHAISVQMGLYANAPLVAVGGEWKGDTYITEEFEPWPPRDLDTETGYVLHMTEKGTAVVPFDILSGSVLYDLAIKPILSWRTRRGLVGKPRASRATTRQFAELADPIMANPVRAESVARHRQEAVDEMNGVTRLPTREELSRTIRAMPELAKQAIRDKWPAGVPGLFADPGPSAAGLMAVARLVDSVAQWIDPAQYAESPLEAPTEPQEAPEPAPAPTGATGATEEPEAPVVEDLRRLMAGPSVLAPTEEATVTSLHRGPTQAYANWDLSWHEGGSPATSEQLETVRGAFTALSAGLRGTINRWVTEGNDDSAHWGDLKSHPTVRRVSLAHVAVGLARAFDGDDELAKAALRAAMGIDHIPSVGAGIGRLTEDQASACLDIARAYSLDSSIVRFGEDGGALFERVSNE